MASIQFAGLASGIDSTSIINSIIQARSTPNTFRQANIDFLNSENDALDQFNTKLAALSDLIEKFRSTNGGGVLKKASSSNSSNVTAAAGANAANTSFDVNITTIAKTANGSFDHAYASGTTYVSTSGSGNVTVTVGDPLDPQATITVPVTANVTTVDDFVNAVNAATGASGNVFASKVNVGTSATPSYRIMFSTLHTGETDGKLTVAADPAITELASSTIDQATNATFTVSGITGTITRDTNTISDVVTGVSFQLLKSSSSATISVSTDASSTSDSVSSIVEAYNDLVKFINENNTVTQNKQGNGTSTDTSSDNSNTFGPLAKTSVDDNFLHDFQSQLSGASSAIGTIVTSMAELGIATNEDGTLTFDAEQFKTNVASDPTGAADVLRDFADNVGGTSGTIYQYTKFQGFIDVAIDSNNSEIGNLNDAIDQLNRSNDTLRASLENQFSNLEVVVGQLNNQQQALSGLLASLG